MVLPIVTRVKQNLYFLLTVTVLKKDITLMKNRMM